MAEDHPGYSSQGQHSDATTQDRGGNFGDSKPVGEGVNELRIYTGPGYRVYYGMHGASLVILLCGGDKASQSKDIARAKKFWMEWKRRQP